MRRTKVGLFSTGLFIGSLSLISSAYAASEATDTVPPPPQIQQADPNAPGDAAQPQTAQPDAAPMQGNPQTQTDGVSPTPSPAPQPDNGKPSYDLTTIIIDYKEYKIGDTVPAEYTDKTYTIGEWQKRNLPAPQENTHWAYINANYILITNDTGKIVMGKSGDIFFRG